MATSAKDLRTGRPIWKGRRAAIVPQLGLTKNFKTDVVVIGAGLTGAVAHKLLPNLDTTAEFAWTGAFGEADTPII